jgi:hypothetical protein
MPFKVFRKAGSKKLVVPHVVTACHEVALVGDANLLVRLQCERLGAVDLLMGPELAYKLAEALGAQGAANVKEPPSQRPERQGPHLYSVGSPYHPDRKMWPDGAQFNYRDGDLELALFPDQPTPSEVKAVKTGRADFGLYDADGLAVLLYRFGHDQGGVPYRFRHDQGGVPWSDVPYHFGLVSKAEQVLPPDPGQLTPETRALLHVILVNASGGQIQALRTVSLSPEFTARLFGAIRAQASGPFDSRAYHSQLKALHYQYPSSSQLAEACSVRCEGGA